MFPHGNPKPSFNGRAGALDAFFQALHDGDVGAAKRTLDSHPGASRWTGPNGQPPLITAIAAYYFDSTWTSDRSTRSPALVDLLLQRGADTEARDADGRTALVMEAMTFRRLDVMETLLKAGARTNAPDRHGRTALHYVADSFGSEDAIALLLRYGAQIDAQDHQGNTPLHLAAGVTGHPGYAGSLEALMQAGASASLGNKAGRTALDAALGNPDMDEYREAYSADIIRAALKRRAAVPPVNSAPPPGDSSPPPPGNPSAPPGAATQKDISIGKPIRFKKPPSR
jgi:ankyrin repeat protein